MEIDLVSEGLKFMVLGMSVVLIFLVILVQVMKLQAKIINKFFPEKAPKVVVPTSKNVTQEAHHVAAITAAVTEFRKKS
ncbi:MAG: OadG family protein [Sulfurovum sp.]|nr:OadG family protein [Sulfurovum sp.]MBT8348032.1 OadG family protein [Sulfurovum sp.]NNJ44595.1 OadG family protein [Sulfurovum sp.]